MVYGRGIRRALSVLVLAGCVACAIGSPWRFVVAGDGRSNGSPSKRPEDKNGVNVVVAAKLRDAILAEKAEALLWTGDLVVGARSATEFRSQLDTWMGVMRPLWDAGVEVLAVRGNHELACPESVSVWNEVFGGKHAFPQNGPVNAKNLSFYAYRHNALFVGIDQYAGPRGSLPLNWLSGVLNGRKAQHVFAFGHEMAFMAGNHTDCLDRVPEARNEFWRLLEKGGSRAYFAGHDHFYDHMAVTGGGTGEIHQFVAGTAGAPLYRSKEYSGKNGPFKLVRVKHIDEAYGYLLVEIDGKRATITFKGLNAAGMFVPMDRWSYEAN